MKWCSYKFFQVIAMGELGNWRIGELDNWGTGELGKSQIFFYNWTL